MRQPKRVERHERRGQLRAGRLRLSVAQRILQHLRLDIEESQALGNRIMQFLSKQIALFKNRQFLLAGAQTLVFNRHAEMLADGFEQAFFLRRHRVGLEKIKVINPQPALAMQNIESRRRGKTFTDAAA